MSSVFAIVSAVSPRSIALRLLARHPYTLCVFCVKVPLPLLLGSSVWRRAAAARISERRRTHSRLAAWDALALTWASTASSRCSAGLLIAVAAVAACAGCCCGLRWGLLLGSACPRFPKRLLGPVLRRVLAFDHSSPRNAKKLRAAYNRG